MGIKYSLVMMLSVLLMVSLMVPHLVFSITEFQVGGNVVGWSIPPNNDTNLYNSWASHNRFRVGDTIYFKYKKDSVFVVEKEDYQNCDASNPISKFADGHTVFELEHSGFYYFISGQPSHCTSGQRMIIRVMVQSETEKNSTATKSDGADKKGDHASDNFGPPGFNATTRLSVASCFMTALVAMSIVVYMFK